MSPTIEVRALTREDLPACRAIHAQSFEKGWDETSLGEYFPPHGLAYGAVSGDTILGFILMGALTDQTDIITIAVLPQHRGHGIGRHILEAAEKEAKALGVELIFLEVAEDNDDAIALYKGAGYHAIGKRKNYYRRAGGRVSAVTMRKTLVAKT